MSLSADFIQSLFSSFDALMNKKSSQRTQEEQPENIFTDAFGEAASFPRQVKLTTTKTKRYFLLMVALIVVASFYAYQFLIEGGREFLGTDSQRYLSIANGEAVTVPFHTRIVGPLIAVIITQITGGTLKTSFQFLMGISFFSAILLLINLLRKRGATEFYQATVVITFSGLASVFGHESIRVDALFFLMICLVIAALDRQQHTIALAFICIATLTKEYGIFLVFPWAVQAYKAIEKYVLIGVFLPVGLLLVANHFIPAKPQDLNETIIYQIRTIRDVGLSTYSKFAYVGFWGACGPLLLLAAMGLTQNWRTQRLLSLQNLMSDQIRFAILLISIPVLLIGDWDRTFILIIPFACIAASPLSFTRDSRYCVLIIFGAISTTLARRFNTETVLPQALINIMIVISVLASISILVMIIQDFQKKDKLQL